MYTNKETFNCWKQIHLDIKPCPEHCGVTGVCPFMEPCAKHYGPERAEPATKVVNIKNGKHYTVINDNAIDCTNDRDGLRVVIYTDDSGMVFVREYSEFLDKFDTDEKRAP